MAWVTQRKAFTISLVLTALFCVVTANDINSFKTNKVEFKTQAPPGPFPEAPKGIMSRIANPTPAGFAILDKGIFGFAILDMVKLGSLFLTWEVLKDVFITSDDCYEYLYGKLSAIRRHGTTWQNGVADCSNCTCDNGDIRCFFHFCNEPSTGYMTPPTIDGDSALPAPATERDPIEDDTTEEESSGFPPDDVLADEDADDETGAEWPPKIVPEKWQNELSAFETSSAPSASVAKTDGSFSFLKDKERKDRTENETHDVLRTYFCGKTCKRICPQGFKIDLVTGCWKCKCNACPSHVTCKNKCVFGYSFDANGCETCACLAASDSNNEDIVFTDEDETTNLSNDEGEVEEGEEEEEFRLESSESRNSSSSSSSEEGEEEEEEEEEKWVVSKTTITPSEGRTVVPPEGRVTTTTKEISSKDIEVTSFPDIQEALLRNHDNGEEPCNTTQLRGCLDGTLKFPVGGSWSRGPCVACKCVAPGYSECNITQCHALHNCPQSRRFTPTGACCAVCKEDTPTPGFLERSHESRSTSRVPTDLFPPKHAEGSLLQKEELAVTKEKDDEATIRSIPKDDQSHLLLILIPMGVLFSMGVLLFAHLWRRYHRDKYDINAYRPEEKQKLRPVKTLNDDTSSLGHVC